MSERLCKQCLPDGTCWFKQTVDELIAPLSEPVKEPPLSIAQQIANMRDQVDPNCPNSYYNPDYPGKNLL